MLILVAVTVNTAVNSGLFGHAKNATSKWADEQEKERNLGNGPIIINGEEYGSIDEYLEKVEKERTIYKSGIWRARKSTEKNLTILKLEVYSEYYALTLNQYKEKYIVQELNKILPDLILEWSDISNDAIKTVSTLDEFLYILLDPETESEIFSTDGGREWFLLGCLIPESSAIPQKYIPKNFEELIIEEQVKIIKEVYANMILEEFGYSKENITQIEREYEKYKNSIPEIPEEIKTATYTIVYPDGTIEEVLGSDLVSFKSTYNVAKRGENTIRITALDKNEEKITIAFNNLMLKYTDNWYEYTFSNLAQGWNVIAKDKTLTNYGKFQTNIYGKPVLGLIGTFEDCTNLTEISFNGIDTSKIISMFSMFKGCTSLKNINFSGINTAGVRSMSLMFWDCSSLKNLDLSTFDTSSVENMNDMFYNCSQLIDLDVSSFDTSVTTSMIGIFSHCSSLESLDVSNFDTSKVTNMVDMFGNCNNLKSLDLSNLDTSSVEDMCLMFFNCSQLKSLDLSNFDTSSVKKMSNMFAGCSQLKSLDLSNFDTSSLNDMSYMFDRCYQLESIDLSNFNTSSVEGMENMFAYCYQLKSLDLSSFNTSKVIRMDALFNNCTNLTTIYVGDNWVVPSENATDMFTNCGTSEVTKK